MPTKTDESEAAAPAESEEVDLEALEDAEGTSGPQAEGEEPPAAAVAEAEGSDGEAEGEGEGAEPTPAQKLATLRESNPELFETPNGQLPTANQGDDPDDVYDDLGRIDPNRLEARSAARQQEAALILRDIQTSVPDMPGEALDRLRQNLYAPVDRPDGTTSPLSVKELRSLRESRSLTGQVKMAVETEIAEGRLKPAKSQARVPAAKSTPNNGGAQASVQLSEAEDAGVRRMAERDGLTYDEAKTSYMRHRPKPKG